MNKNIEEIYTKTKPINLIGQILQDRYGPTRSLAANEIDRFTDLLLKECIRLIENIPTRTEYLGGQSFNYIKLCDTVETLKVHFGVE